MAALRPPWLRPASAPAPACAAPRRRAVAVGRCLRISHTAEKTVPIGGR